VVVRVAVVGGVGVAVGVAVGVRVLVERAVRVHHEVLLGLRGGEVGEGRLGELVVAVAGVPAHGHGDGRGGHGGRGRRLVVVRVVETQLPLQVVVGAPVAGARSGRRAVELLVLVVASVLGLCGSAALAALAALPLARSHRRSLALLAGP